MGLQLINNNVARGRLVKDISDLSLVFQNEGENKITNI